MPSENSRTEQQRQHLVALLERLFQLDQPDLDFGFYKIMHAKAAAVTNFLQNDMREIINDTFGEVDETEIRTTWMNYIDAIKTAKEFKSKDPENAPPVLKAKKKYEAAKARDEREGEVYDNLYRFFERYYDNGDFLSRRYHAREDAGKAAPYAIPYDGREVYLHWANRDQYYIKTAEHLSNFTADIAKHWKSDEERTLNNIPDSLKLHCRIVEAAEGEHNNNKANGKTERFFLIYADQPVLMENGELVLQFEYRPDSEKSGQNGTWQKKCLDDAETAIMNALADMADAASYTDILRMEIGEDDNKRTLLRKYLNQYTKRNTMDYFIHKDLGNFLKRELDFYIKNEIMHLDDIANADAPQVEDYLSKIKVLRKMGGHLIAILTQLEEFQKKLWLKKKFVTETNYCITLDRIPETFYTDIAANEAQRQEWVTLFAIDDLDGYSAPLSKNFLVANSYLVLDTAFFSSEFKDSLLAAMQDLDKNIDGLLIHGENFQALGLMEQKYQEQVKCIYIDPPYNTGGDGFIYKDSYQHSGWLSMMENRLIQAKAELSDNGLIFISIDDNEFAKLKELCDAVFGKENFVSTFLWKKKGTTSNIKDAQVSSQVDYQLCYKNSENSRIKQRVKSAEDRNYPNSDEGGNYRTEIIEKKDSGGYKRDTMKYKILGHLPRVGKRWQIGENLARELEANNRFIWDGEKIILKIYDYDDGETYSAQPNLLDNHGTSDRGAKLTNDELFNTPELFANPKPVELPKHLISIASDSDDIISDYFAGSGTTGHAVINLNREDGGKRKYIMVEMGSYFDAVTKPRIQKVVYSEDWKEGKPVSRKGVSHAFKYLRLESYEDALNNLYFKEDAVRDGVLANNGDLRREYMLKYWLDFETQDSPSLLNTLRFDDPTGYMLKVKKPGSDEQEEKAVDLVETFNWLIGLHVDYADQWRGFTGNFTREPDPELPLDNTTRLIFDGSMEESSDGKWQFRKIEGRVCRTPGNMENAIRVLVIWRKLTGNAEEDNVMLDEWFKRYRSSANGNMPDVVYVNGGSNLQRLCEDGEHWKVCPIEHAFHKQMWGGEV